MSNSSDSSDSSDKELRANAICASIDMLDSKGFRFLGATGKGTYGDIVSLYDTNSGSYKAAKIIVPKNASVEELVIWSKLDHKNIVTAENVALLGDGTLIITMAHQFKSLDTIQQDEEFVNCSRSYDWMRKWLHDALQGLEYMHKKQICHLDLKLDNVLVGYDGVATLCDFSHATDATESLSHRDIGVPRVYCPPESLCNRKKVILGNLVDSWTFGMLILESVTVQSMMTYVKKDKRWTSDVKPMLKLFLRQEIFQVLLEEAFPNFRFCPEVVVHALDIIDAFLRVMPHDRIEASSALEHVFFRNVEKVRVHFPDIYATEDLYPRLHPDIVVPAAEVAEKPSSCVRPRRRRKKTLQMRLQQSLWIRHSWEFVSFRMDSARPCRIYKWMKVFDLRKLRPYLRHLSDYDLKRCFELCVVDIDKRQKSAIL